MVIIRENKIWDVDTGIEDFLEDPMDLTSSEILGIQACWEDQQDQLRDNPHIIDEFIERLGTEWAIETGVIENLYDIERGVTAKLIRHGLKAEYLFSGSVNKPVDYVLKLLIDHKDCFDGLFDFIKGDRQLTTSYVKELHASLVQSQESAEGRDKFGRTLEIPLIKGDWKKRENSPVRDGVKYVYCPPEHVQSEMDRLLRFHDRHIQDGVSSEVQSAWLHHRFTQIHPFQDGNGRVARALASLILLKNGLFPLIITRDDRPSYIDALEEADKGDLQPLVHVFVKSQQSQFRKASKIADITYTGTPSTDSALKILQASASAYNNASKRKLLSHAREIEEDLKSQLETLVPKIKDVLEQIYPAPTVYISESDENTDHYYRYQIIENAKRWEYYANTDTYRLWIDLRMYWTRRARLVFSIHGIGKHVNLEALVCSPFLDLKEIVEDGEEAVSSLIPVADDGFVFFKSEDPQQLKRRFSSWLDQVLSTFLIELSQNL